MKLEPLFTVKENKLYKLADNSPVDYANIKRIELPWSAVELEDEAYNEEMLAALRDQLKSMEAAGIFAVLVPVVDKTLDSPEKVELFINAYNHAARRVKDCASVVGFEFPEQVSAGGFQEGSIAACFMETLAIKHAQYVYFAHSENAPKDTVVLL